MLAGTADPKSLAARAPKLASLDTEPLELRDVDVVQVFSEIGSQGIEALLPPALHPTLPPIVSWLIYRCISSPWGAYMATGTRRRKEVASCPGRAITTSPVRLRPATPMKWPNFWLILLVTFPKMPPSNCSRPMA